MLLPTVPWVSHQNDTYESTILARSLLVTLGLIVGAMHVVLIFLGTLASMKREVCCEGDWELGVERGKKTSVRKFDEYGDMMTLIIVMSRDGHRDLEDSSGRVFVGDIMFTFLLLNTE